MIGQEQCPACGRPIDVRTAKYVDPQTGKEISKDARGSWSLGFWVMIGCAAILVLPLYPTISSTSSSNPSSITLGLVVSGSVWTVFFIVVFLAERMRKAALLQADRLYRCPRCLERWTVKRSTFSER